MGTMQRRKGGVGQRAFKRLLTDRDWMVDTISCGIKSEDLIAENPLGTRYSVEVKNHAIINIRSFLSQAKEQAMKRKLPWMLAVRLPQFANSWLVCIQGEEPIIWNGK